MSREMTRREEHAPETVDQQRWNVPAVDIYENEQELLLRADMPGVSSETLNIDLDKDQLTIEGRRGAEPEGAVLGREFVSVGYRRRFQLIEGIDFEKVSAALQDGVLTVKLPKAEALRPRRIEVKAG